MKKVSIAILLMMFMVFFTTSCSKGDDVSISLEGKRYVAQGSTFTYTIWGTTYNYTPFYMYRFISSSSYEYTIRENSANGKIRSTEYGTYTLNYPRVVFRKSSSDETTTGTFLDKSTIRIGLYEYVQQ